MKKPKKSIKGKRTIYLVDNTAADQQREYVGSVLLRREQLAKKREQDASDLGKLIHQYSTIIKERGEDTISSYLQYYIVMQRKVLYLMSNISIRCLEKP